MGDFLIGLGHTPYEGNYNSMFKKYNAKKMESTVNSIAVALRKNGYNVVLLPIDNQIFVNIKKYKPTLIFNYATGVNEKNSQAITAGLLESTKIPYTCSSMKTHLLALYKDLAKLAFFSKGINTPKFQIFKKYNDKTKVKFPLFVKPLHEGSSFGIDKNSVVKDKEQLKNKIKEINENYNQAALVEEFIAGREFTVGVWGNEKIEILPILELTFNNENNINTMKSKNTRSMKEICPARISENIKQKIKNMAIKAYQALGCKDYSRVDFRMSSEGELYVLEINSLPSLKANRSSFLTMSKNQGYDYDSTINRIVELALKRWDLLK